MPVTPRVLLTCRTACAAWSMIEIFQYLLQQTRFELKVLAQAPATEILTGQAVPHVRVPMSFTQDASSQTAADLLNYASAALGDYQPDSILSGLSIPTEGGIDEAIIAKATQPSFVVQDFWGDNNCFFGRHPDCYLSIDEHGEALTNALHGAVGRAIGSPRHARYSGSNFVEKRRRLLLERDLSPAANYAGLFSQPLLDVPGYGETLRAWAEAVRDDSWPSTVIHRPHPACSNTDLQYIQALLVDCGLTPVVLKDGPVEDAIAVCGLMSSALSNSNFDGAYVNHFASAPITVPHYMVWDASLSDHLSSFHDLDYLPMVRSGTAIATRRIEALPSDIAAARNERVRRDIWQGARQLPDPREALEKIREIVADPEGYLATL
jgi:hypothetical protein